MRIITGKFKGRTLQTVPDRSVRPATDRVKGAIFNVLQNRLRIIDALVLDLFAGSGSLGFEALSRGAAHAVFVESQRKVLSTIETNAAVLGCLDSCDIIDADALSFIQQSRRPFDLIFADPPYAYQNTTGIPQAVFERGLLRTGGFLIIEHAKEAMFGPSELYKVAVQKEFGNTRVSFFTSPT